jgi:VWFA-related protein
MKRVVFVLIGCLAVAAGFAWATRARAASQQEKSETLKIRSTEILVDAVVQDRKNRLVTDLTAQDFEVYEGGVLQDVSSFRVVRGQDEKSDETKPVARPGQPAKSQPGPDETRPAAAPETLPNVTIVLLDYSTTQIQNKRLVQEAAVKYVEKRLQPNDFMAVFVLGAGLHIACDFTNNKEKLIAALKKTALTGTAMASDRADLSAMIERGDSASNQVDVESALGAAANGPGAAAQGSAMSAALIAQHFAAMAIGMRAGMDRIQSLGVLSAIRAIAMGVKGIEGRKALLLFTEGFVAGPSVEEELKQVTGLANRSQLAIYCIESQGLETRELRGDLVPRDELTAAAAGTQESRMTAHGGETNFDRTRQSGQDVREGALRYVAASTGGLLVRNTNDLSTGLDRIDRETRSYYLLSYRPKDEKLDGGFRQIRVSVKRPDLTVRARSGYYAMPAGYELLSPDEFRLIGEAGKADAAKFPLFVRTAGFQEVRNEYTVPVVVEIPYASIQFDVNKGSHSARLLVLGIVRDTGGNLVRRFGSPAQMNLAEAQYNTLKAGTVSLMNQVQVPPGDYWVEVYVKDHISGAVSSGRQALYLGQMESTFGMSAVLLASDRELYKSLAKDDKFLTVQGVKIMPSAACQFRNGDNMIFYFYIYNPQVDKEKQKTDISVEVKLEREGQAVNAALPAFQVTEGPGGTVPHVTFSRFLRLSGLKPGGYNLVLSVKDRVANQSARREAAFVVLN